MKSQVSRKFCEKKSDCIPLTSIHIQVTGGNLIAAIILSLLEKKHNCLMSNKETRFLLGGDNACTHVASVKDYSDIFSNTVSYDAILRARKLLVDIGIIKEDARGNGGQYIDITFYPEAVKNIMKRFRRK